MLFYYSHFSNFLGKVLVLLLHFYGLLVSITANNSLSCLSPAVKNPHPSFFRACMVFLPSSPRQPVCYFFLSHFLHALRTNGPKQSSFLACFKPSLRSMQKAVVLQPPPPSNLCQKKNNPKLFIIMCRYRTKHFQRYKFNLYFVR